MRVNTLSRSDMPYVLSAIITCTVRVESDRWFSRRELLEQCLRDGVATLEGFTTRFSRYPEPLRSRVFSQALDLAVVGLHIRVSGSEIFYHCR